MSDCFLPAVPGECLPCEAPTELVWRLSGRMGVRPWLKVMNATAMTVYSRDDPSLSEGQVEQIKQLARGSIFAMLQGNQLRSFVQSARSGDFYRIPAIYWAKLVDVGAGIEPAWDLTFDSAGKASGLPDRADSTRMQRLDSYQLCDIIKRPQGEFVGQPILIAKSDGDAILNCPPGARPTVATPVNYTLSASANENTRTSQSTGCAGRPPMASAALTVLLRKRADEGRMLPKLNAEMVALLAEFRADPANAEKDTPQPESLGNTLRYIHKELKSEPQWPKPD